MDGLINVYKEAGYTSHDVVAKLRGILHQKKIGHTGTLDPAAVGVLPVCLGKATKVCEMLAGQDKTYRAVCRLGVCTDTQDMTGTVLETRDATGVTEETLEACLADFCGEVLQVPPMYSALKVQGRKLYELAREGKTVERAPRRIYIHDLRLLAYDPAAHCFSMEVTCSKGTYIRTLCHDIGQALGCLGAMQSLERTRVGCFTAADALTLAQIEQFAVLGSLQEHVISVDRLFPEYPAFQIRRSFAGKLANGNPLREAFLEKIPGREISENGSLQEGQALLVYDETGDFRAVYRKGAQDLRVWKMF